MRDSEFKELRHVTGSLRIHSRGTEIAPGYKPDLTLVDNLGKVQFILECEQKTDRKAFIGDFIKAEMFSEENDHHPALIIVMQEQDNTKVRHISRHLQPYVSWLTKLRRAPLNVPLLLVMSDIQYMASLEQSEQIGSSQFFGRGDRVSSNQAL